MVKHQYNSFCFWKQRLIAAAEVLCICVVFALPQAQASCGDYVMIGGHSKSDAMAIDHSGNRPDFPICRGSACGERRESPSSPPLRLTLDEHSWGLSPKVADLAPDPCRFCDQSVDPTVAISMATGVFRPPRFASAV